MILVKPKISFLNCTPHPLQTIEAAGRTCYKSEDKITDDSAPKFVKMIIDRGHTAMLEHASMSYRVICDRGVTHEIVRHRLFSYAQESTRYCDYKDGHVAFVMPCWFHANPFQDGEVISLKKHPELGEIIESNEDVWLWAMQNAENYYHILRRNNWSPQQARSVLPNSLKTEIVITGNFREWIHFFCLRLPSSAHPQMREIASLIYKDASTRIPVVFGDIETA